MLGASLAIWQLLISLDNDILSGWCRKNIVKVTKPGVSSFLAVIFWYEIAFSIIFVRHSSLWIDSACMMAHIGGDRWLPSLSLFAIHDYLALYEGPAWTKVDVTHWGLLVSNLHYLSSNIGASRKCLQIRGALRLILLTFLTIRFSLSFKVIPVHCVFNLVDSLFFVEVARCAHQVGPLLATLLVNDLLHDGQPWDVRALQELELFFG